MKRKHKQWVGLVVVVAALAGVGGYLWMHNHKSAAQGPAAAQASGALAIQAGPRNATLAPADPASHAPNAPGSPSPLAVPIELSAQPPAVSANAEPATAAPVADATAGGAPAPAHVAAALQRGKELLQADKLLEARAALNDAFFAGGLTPQQEKQAIADLTMLAEMTIFTPRIAGDDPYAMQYTIRPGDNLTAVERKLALHVPTQILAKINNLPSPSAITGGQTLKLIQGPVHAVVSKSRFTMDLYLHREGLPRVFLLRLPVGLGREDSTPLGRFQVELGKKLRNATWNPPAGSARTGSFRPGDSGYPLGKAGFWISLVGLDPATAACQGYGIHGTNDPGSIGANASLGCIRLNDYDIELVFSLLYEKWSTVTIVP